MRKTFAFYLAILLCSAAAFSSEGPSDRELEAILSVMDSDEFDSSKPDVVSRTATRAKELAPQLKAILLTTNSEIVSVNILYVFIRAKLDDRSIVETVKQFLKKNQVPEYAKPIVTAVSITALGELGNAEDAVYLMNEIDSELLDSGLRRHTLEAVAKIGDERAQQMMAKWLAAKSAKARTAKEKAAAAEAMRSIAKRLQN